MTADPQTAALAAARQRQAAAAEAEAARQTSLLPADQQRLDALAADADKLTLALGLLAAEVQSAAGAQVAMRSLAIARQLKAMLAVKLAPPAG